MCRRCCSPWISRLSRHSRRSVPTYRSAKEFARGDRIGVLMIRTPVPASTSSKTVVNLLSRSRDQEPEPGGAFAKVHQQVAGLLGGPFPGEAGGDAQDVHPPCADLDHEEHVQASEEHGVNVQEIARQDPGRLAGQELPPCRGCPAGCGREPGFGQYPADRSFADAVPEAEELALDAPVPLGEGSAWPAAGPARGSPPGPAGVRWCSDRPICS